MHLGIFETVPYYYVQFNYLGLDGARCYYLTELSYASTMISWIFYRLWEFPTRVIWSASSGFATRCPDQALELTRRGSWVDIALGHYQQDCVSGLYANITLLWTLFVLHCWWFFLLARIGYILLTEDVPAASTREYEGDMDTSKKAQLTPQAEESKKLK
jgi:ceramide synthetase